MPVKILQFGEGNFLRAFVNHFVDVLNGMGKFGGSVVVVQPIAQGLADMLSAQDCRYTVLLRGLEGGKEKIEQREITCISRALSPYANYTEYMAQMENPDLRYIISNTTEAGIAYGEGDTLTDEPPAGFPAKVTQLLYRRWELFAGDVEKGFIFIPCELIDNGGNALKKIVERYASEWGLPQEFIDWIGTANYFANTLVDRIVTGYPRDEQGELDRIAEEVGYGDQLVVTGEIFHFWAIEAPTKAIEEMNRDLPFREAGLDVLLADDISPYKLRKVRILNGAHTMSIPAAMAAGIETVGEMMDDEIFAEYLHCGIFNEIIPAIEDRVSRRELTGFADSVFDRFANPYIRHYLSSIALNSVAKYAARVLPTITDFHKKMGTLPTLLTFSFAALVHLYRGANANDDASVIEFMASESVENICANEKFWGADLTQLPGFVAAVEGNLHEIETQGTRAAIAALLEQQA